MAAEERPAAGIEDFDTIVRLYWRDIARFVLASVRDRDAAGSLTQDCFLKAHRALARFRGDCSLRTWLLQIAVNLVRDHARNRRVQFWNRARESSVNAEQTCLWLRDLDLSPEARASAREQVRAVWQATGSLPEKQRTVFLLRFVEDMNLLEIAAVTGLKEGTVKAHLFRALQSVRERLRRPQ